MRNHSRYRPAFTLVELLVVIVIIAMLVAILLPALQRAKEQARKIQCASQMRQINVALYSYAMDSDGWFPMVNWSSPVLFLQTDHPASIRSYFGFAERPSDQQLAGTLAVLLCPAKDPRIESRHVNYGSGGSSTGMTYQVVAAHGSRAAGPWYGWPVSARDGVHGTPMPRLEFTGGRTKLSSSEQPTASDLWAPEGTAYVYGGSRYNLPEDRARNNHVDGSNIGFADGHVEWRNADRFQHFMHFYSQRNRLWW